MQIEYDNVKEYLFFLAKKYEPTHYEPLRAVCHLEESVKGLSSIRRLLTFALAYCEAHISRRSPIVKATYELLMYCYAAELEPQFDMESI